MAVDYVSAGQELTANGRTVAVVTGDDSLYITQDLNLQEKYKMLRMMMINMYKMIII